MVVINGQNRTEENEMQMADNCVIGWTLFPLWFILSLSKQKHLLEKKKISTTCTACFAGDP